MAEKARDLMKIGVKTVEKDCSIYEAIRILVEHRISGLPVVDDRKIVGIITEKDVLQLVVRERHLPGPVEAYMTRQVVAFDEEEDVATIWSCLVGNSFRRVPILRGGNLTGIISRTDLLRDRIGDFGPRSPRRSWQGLEGPSVREVMTAGLITTTPGSSVADAAQTLLDNEITGLPVVDNAMNLLGILSEKDILKLLDNGPAQPWRVLDVMTFNVTSFDADDSLYDVCECLARNSFRRVPVLGRGKLVGIVSRADLIIYILKNRSMLFQDKSPAGVLVAR
jgi:CBS domain-containing protein